MRVWTGADTQARVEMYGTYQALLDGLLDLVNLDLRETTDFEEALRCGTVHKLTFD
jgi:hypothetical protein